MIDGTDENGDFNFHQLKAPKSRSPNGHFPGPRTINRWVHETTLSFFESILVNISFSATKINRLQVGDPGITSRNQEIESGTRPGRLGKVL